MRHAVINGNNLVVNVIQLVDSTQWHPPLNCIVVPTDTGNIGDTFNGANFISPPTVNALPLSSDQLFDMLIANRCLTVALMKALNDGSFPIGSNLLAIQIKNILKAKL